MKALILAAGYATRLYPLTKEYPKPLLTVGHRPIIDYIVDKVTAIELIDEIFIVTNSKFFFRFKKWADELDIGKRLTLVDDLSKDQSDKLGAIGDMNFVITKEYINDDLLVIGGDNLFDEGLEGFLSFAKKQNNHPVIGIFDVGDVNEVKKYGIVKLGSEKNIIDFKEKTEHPHSTLAAMCLYYFPKSTLLLIKEYLGHKHGTHDATGFYIDWLRKKIPTYGYVFKGRWYDIGDHKFLNQAKESFVRQTEGH